MNNPNYDELLAISACNEDPMSPQPIRQVLRMLAKWMQETKQDDIDADKVLALANAQAEAIDSLPESDRPGFAAMSRHHKECIAPDDPILIYTNGYGDKEWCEQKRKYWNAIAAAAIEQHEKQKQEAS